MILWLINLIVKDNLFEKAYERILSEFQIVLNVSLEDTQKKLDKALKKKSWRSSSTL